MNAAYIDPERSAESSESRRIVGNTQLMAQKLREIEQVAPTDATVLVRGESGTGKELIARAIHFSSRRREGPLVIVNCGALSDGVVESELFGHEKGAFTGASGRRIGKFEAADGGTLFLDEVGELPPDTQVKLLRALQEGEFERVGGNQTIRVDVRVVAATNRNMEEAVAQGEFRADLFFRLNVFPIDVPPLRDRRADIPLLVEHLLDKLATRLDKPIAGVSDGSMQQLLAYDWPGNVRELENVLERSVILSLGPVIDVVGLKPACVAEVEQPTEAEEVLPLAEMEKRHIQKALARTRWIVSGPEGAATLLRINPNTLRSRMKKLGIARSIACAA